MSRRIGAILVAAILVFTLGTAVYAAVTRKADLAVQSISPSSSKLVVQVINRGTTKSNATQVVVTIGSMTVSRSLPALAPGQSHLLTVPLPSNGKLASVVVDPKNKVVDSNRVNNRQVWKTTVLETRPEVGFLAPDLSLESIDGTASTLSSYRGKVVLINFFATWCGPCRGEMPDLEKLYLQYKDKGLVLLAVDVDQSEDTPLLQKFVTDNNLTFPFHLADRRDQNATVYGISSIPHTFIIDAKGVIRQSLLGAQELTTFQNAVKPFLAK